MMERQDTSHIDSLDGLRGLAILSVMVFHCLQLPPQTAVLGMILDRFVKSGWIGVDLFFVLSGFLITRTLLTTRSAENYYKIFYSRRALRLFPVYYLAVILMFWVVLPASHLHGFVGEGLRRYLPWGAPASEQVWYWLNISNLRGAFYPVRIPLLSIFWTLAIEEQFYLVWPACVRVIKPRNLPTICVAGMIVIALMRLLPAVQLENRIYSDFIYRMTPFHMDGLFCGALLGALFRYGWGWERLTKIVLRALPVLLACSIYVEYFLPAKLAAFHFDFTLLALLFGALVWVCVMPGQVPWLKALLGVPLLRSFGRYSYFMYVFHLWVLSILPAANGHLVTRLDHGRLGSLAAIVVAVLAIAIVYGLGAMSWRVYEGPILAQKRRFKYSMGKRDHAVSVASTR